MIHRNILRILIGCTLLLGVVQTVDAQLFQATRSHLSAEDGLVSNAVSGIYQDDLGYLWIATWNGLSRYIITGLAMPAESTTCITAFWIS